MIDKLLYRTNENFPSENPNRESTEKDSLKLLSNVKNPVRVALLKLRVYSEVMFLTNTKMEKQTL